MQKDYNGQELRGCQHALGKLRTKAKGFWVQTKGEERYFALNREERKRMDRATITSAFNVLQPLSWPH